MSHEEIVDIHDEAGNVVGSVSRLEAEQGNHTIKNAIVFLFNSKGETWKQLRPMTKRDFKGLWDVSACGGVESHETVEQAAVRETFEETGLRAKLYHVKTFTNTFVLGDGQSTTRLSSVFVGLMDEEPQADGVEVERFEKALPKALRKDAQEHPEQYVPTFILELDIAVEGFEKIHPGVLK